MLESLFRWKDTIIALATPPGSGAIGVIRISGPASFNIINTLFPSKDISQQPSHTLHIGWLVFNHEPLDEVVVSLFKNPRSYTGEDIVEISCHGSTYIINSIMQACIQLGARTAKPGEFTQRAFLNGKLDLAQAEAVADLIASNTEASRKAALHTMRGGFSSDLQQLREALIGFSALIELELDFSQEDVEFADHSKFKELIIQLKKSTQQLIASFKLGNVIKNGVQVAIIGKPNAGKSTLLNTLLNENRSIVSDIAGTTRDTIEEVLNIEGVLFRLIDTAGIREDTSNSIEQIGVNKSKEKMRSAQVVLYLFDVHEMQVNELQDLSNEMKAEQINYILVGNKADELTTALREKFAGFEHCIFISAKSQQNIELLREQLVKNTIGGAIQMESTIVTNARHYEALVALNNFLQEVEEGLNNRIPGDLLALDIRQCLHHLGTITGQITYEDQLDFIFSKFCIGK